MAAQAGDVPAYMVTPMRSMNPNGSLAVIYYRYMIYILNTFNPPNFIVFVI